ncbi:MAG: TolC family protein, partial [Verrucomicrobiota bacterium]
MIDRALASNPDLIVERENIQINRDQVLRELGEFGWRLEGAFDQHRSWDPLNAREFVQVGEISIPGNDARVYHEHRQTAQAALKRKTSFGTEVALRLNVSRLINSTNEQVKDPDSNSVALFSPELEGFAGISISQPLLRGLGMSNTLAEVELAELKVSAALLLTRVQAMNLVAEVASRYIDVLAADEALALRKDNVRRAEDLVERNRRREEAGVGVEIEVTTARLAVSQRQSELIETAAEKVERMNNLLALLDEDPTFADGVDFAPVDELFSGEERDDPAELRNFARLVRADILYYQRVVDSAELNLERAEDSVRPQLDLTASYGVNALAGTAENLANAFEDRQGEEWSVGFLLKMDLERRAPRATVRVAQRQLFQARVELSKALRSVALEIDTALQRTESAEQRLTTAEEAAALAAKRLEQELQALEQGKGDLYRVVEQQQILGDTEVEVAATRAFLRKATVALWMS